MTRQMLFAAITFLLFDGLAFADKSNVQASSGSHFRFTVSGATVNVTTTTPNRLYPNAGIQVLTPGFTISGNVRPTNDGFYLFSVSDSTPASLNFLGSGGTAQIKICLDGVGKKFSCENQTISSIGNSHIIFATSTSYAGNLGGISGADALCQAAAYQAGSVIPTANLQFKALIITPARYPCSSQNAGVSGSCGGSFANNWPLVANTQYVYSNGTAVFNTVNQYGSFNGSNPVMMNEQGVVPSSQNFWFGVQSILASANGLDIAAWAYTDMNSAADGAEYTANLSSCNGFTSSDSSVNGSIGAVGQIALVNSGPVTGNTWGNYYYFNNSATSYMQNMFNESNNVACNTALPIICVS